MNYSTHPKISLLLQNICLKLYLIGQSKNSMRRKERERERKIERLSQTEKGVEKKYEREIEKKMKN